jgi:hypothetical protein
MLEQHWGDLIALGYILAALAVVRIGLPQAASFFLKFFARDGYGLYRFMWMFLMAGICLSSLRESLVFSDWAFFDRRWLGPIEGRVPVELFIAWFKAAGCLFAAGLYEYTQRKGRRSRRGSAS